MTALSATQAAVPLLPLRPYQEDALRAVAEAWERINRPAVILPTGSGKTHCFTHLAAREPGRTLILAHRKELVEQAAGTLRAVVPDLPVGIDMAESYAHPWHRAVVATVQTLSSERRLSRWAPDAFGVVVVDESHHAAAGSYRQLLDYFGCMADGPGGTRAVGFTATLARGDGRGLGSIWQEVAFERSILQMIEDVDPATGRGYLVRPHGISAPLDSFDLSRVRVSHGDYTDASIGEQLELSEFAPKVAAAYREHAADRPGIVFTPTVRTAQMAAEALKAEGFTAAAVWGAMDPGERKKAIAGFRNGDIQILCNCLVLTEGFDAPRASCCAICRPTKSAPLLIQMAGRVLRPYIADDGTVKEDALILDLVQATKQHKLETLKDLSLDPSDDEGEVMKTPEPDEDDEFPKRRRARKAVYGKTEEVDLFGRSTSVWLRTDGGHWFVPAGGGYVFLDPYWPGDGVYTIGWMPPADSPQPVTKLGSAPELPLAMALGERHATHADRASGRAFATSARTAPWRVRAAPTAKQLTTAARLRLDVSASMTSGQVSDMITVRLASRRVDRFLARW